MSKDEFCEYIHTYEKNMYYLALSIVKNEVDATEVMSETIYRAYANLHSLRNKKAFKAWILQIVHNSAVEMIRKNAKEVVLDMVCYDQEAVDDEDINTKLTLQEAVACLKQPYRSVIILYYYNELSMLEIAKITNTNVVTVRKQLSRARNILKNYLKEEIDYEKH